MAFFDIDLSIVFLNDGEYLKAHGICDLIKGIELASYDKLVDLIVEHQSTGMTLRPVSQPILNLTHYTFFI